MVTSQARSRGSSAGWGNGFGVGRWCDPPRVTSSVALQRRRVRRGAGLAERRVVDLLPGSVRLGGGQNVVDLVAERGVGVVEPDAVRLGGERLADDLQLVRLLGGV